MFRPILSLLKKARIGRWCCAAVLAASLGLPGCTSVNLRGDAFPDNELSGFARQVRGADTSGKSLAWSNKARQIEQDLGGP